MFFVCERALGDNSILFPTRWQDRTPEQMTEQNFYDFSTVQGSTHFASIGNHNVPPFIPLKSNNPIIPFVQLALFFHFLYINYSAKLVTFYYRKSRVSEVAD